MYCCLLACVFLLFGLVLLLLGREYCWLAVRNVVGWPWVLFFVGRAFFCFLAVCIVVG